MIAIAHAPHPAIQLIAITKLITAVKMDLHSRCELNSVLARRSRNSCTSSAAAAHRRLGTASIVRMARRLVESRCWAVPKWYLSSGAVGGGGQRGARGVVAGLEGKRSRRLTSGWRSRILRLGLL